MSEELGELLFLSVDEVLTLHADQLRLFGGAEGVRSSPALESAVATPQSTFGGHFLHEDVFAMAAAYAYHLAENQPFIDGNKRTALNAALVFLDINGWLVVDKDGVLYDAMIGIATKTMSKKDLRDLFETLAQPLLDPQTESGLE